ncbi:helix-turn-helix transcriptional regulator [Kineococcus sp. SYSU DK001]|uniref:helix-turn-helix transcriptional regulator n=1 Tax=Kineococcus sp. SYSU DK001 TaxID=3383122 RepID=UPI003D7E30A3
MSEQVRSRRPGVTGIAEVLQARFVEHAYPLHTHDTWTLLLVEDGAVHYDLDRRPHDTGPLLTLLPPHVPHDGRAATPAGFRKRVLYLEPDALPAVSAGRAVDTPELPDARLVGAARELHRRLSGAPGTLDPLDVESRAAVLLDAVGDHLRATTRRPVRDVPLARRLRALLDEHVVDGISLTEASRELSASTAHLVRTFTREVGMPPHAYLTGRRVDLARRLLLAGHRPAEAAALAGFHDQPHLNRHFRRVLGTTPGRFAGG